MFGTQPKERRVTERCNMPSIINRVRVVNGVLGVRDNLVLHVRFLVKDTNLILK